jgi:ribA/ribD-fused uncharacterized protein
MLSPTESIKSREELLQSIERGTAPAFRFFWGHTPKSRSTIDGACFSQWFVRKFVSNGTEYCSAEHFMMASKAALFGDEVTLQKILAAETPDAAKKLGRQVSPFDSAVWAKNAFNIVVAGNACKFGQHEDLKGFLLSTGNEVLVEASPFDTIWGIGMNQDDKRSVNPALWNGQNLLGFALMETRRLLAIK